MRLVSCYKVLAANDQTNGGVGQGGGNYWTDAYGIALQQQIAKELGAEIVLSPRPHGANSFDGGDYDPPEGTADIAYVQLFECPKRRPADFVWTAISDYIGVYRQPFEVFLEKVKPNLVLSLQYPLDPPERIATVPQLGVLPNLVVQCAAHNCRVVYLPWFNVKNITEYNPNKTIAGMCTGKMSGTYPFRDAVWKYLRKMNRPDIVLSGNPTGSTFTLSDEEYRHALARTRYYFSGGIYDLQIPPKFYEVCNHGACLVSHHMPLMVASGFIPGETYVEIESVNQIPMVLESDAWKTIAPAAQKMVHEKHSLEQRARDIVDVYREMTGWGRYYDP